MKLYTLGTSHGATEVGRACSANLLEVGGAYYLFDCGGNTEGKMTDLSLPIEKIRAAYEEQLADGQREPDRGPDLRRRQGLSQERKILDYAV